MVRFSSQLRKKTRLDESFDGSQMKSGKTVQLSVKIDKLRYRLTSNVQLFLGRQIGRARMTIMSLGELVVDKSPNLHFTRLVCHRRNQGLQPCPVRIAILPREAGKSIRAEHDIQDRWLLDDRGRDP
jgi:hypothetical protein